MNEEGLLKLSCASDERDVLHVLQVGVHQVADELFITVLIYDPNDQDRTISLNKKEACELRDWLNRFLEE